MENQDDKPDVIPETKEHLIKNDNVKIESDDQHDDEMKPIQSETKLNPELEYKDSDKKSEKSPESLEIVNSALNAGASVIMANDASDDQSLDEGEIVDDDDDDDNNRVEIGLLTKDKKLCDESGSFSVLKKTTNLILPKEENLSEDDSMGPNGQQRQKNVLLKKDNSEEIESNYSDWSESEDDELLKGEPMQTEIDNDNEVTLIKDDTDLEAISDDDFESINEVVYNKTGGGEFEKLFQKEGFNQISDKEQFEEISILDTLKIDWKSLITEKSIDQTNNDDQNEAKLKEDMDKKARSDQFRKKNSTIAMLNRIGFSHRFAGETMTKSINKYLSDNLGEVYQPMLHPIPALHTFYKNKHNQNEHILGPSNGPNVVMSGDKDRLFHELVNYPFL